MTAASNGAPVISVENLTMAFGDFVLQRDLSFEVHAGDIFVVMGGSGCGKSTLMRHLVGLLNWPRTSGYRWENSPTSRPRPFEKWQP